MRVTLQAGTSTVDAYVVPLGLRSYTFDPAKGFSLNGKAMKLWGMASHHDFGAIGAAYHPRALERQLQILKGMGVNALRTSHNPPLPELWLSLTRWASSSWTRPSTSGKLARMV